ncbi:MAG: acyltransferase domain-containing protein [Synechococcaceae bacterium WB9_2_170]|nr:acyltransferase domain-containing protein [Synechococcaceae bacterium WB9_2_170]
MAHGLLDLPGARERFEEASALLGRDLLAICQGQGSGELADLADTRNTQPALFVIESLLASQLQAQGRSASLVAGHSLGELVALHVAGVFDFATGLALLVFEHSQKFGTGRFHPAFDAFDIVAQ